jgi:hypothetical protein
MSTTKTADSKGRVNLGLAFANRPVIVEQVDELEVRVQLARVMPEREAWLIENEAARASVLRGVRDAAEGNSVDPPDRCSWASHA